MDIEAAVLTEPYSLSVEELALDDPGPDEVLVDVRATGVCHTDHHAYDGKHDVPYPIVLGHEGAGVVEAVGENVTTVRPGDPVVLSVILSCGACGNCESGRPYLCSNGQDVAFGGTMMDGTRRLRSDRGEVNHFFAQSSFATKAVVPARSAVPVPEPSSFAAASLLGCGASTGLGSVLNTAGVSAGESVAVFGCGGVGMSGVMAASAVSADPVVAVDPMAGKRDRAEAIGATATLDPGAVDPVDRIEDLTDGGADYVFEYIGNPDVMEQAIAATATGGTTVLVGSAARTDEIGVRGADLVPGAKTIMGCVGGSVRPRADIPRFVELDAAGRIDLDALVDATYDLDDLDTAFSAMGSSADVRGVVTF